MMKFTYLLINFFTVIFPFLLSFERKIYFRQYWKYLIPATFITAAVFLIWDHYFTVWGIWSFNPKFIIGIFAAGLPVEEWMFFFTIPYACVFSYEVLNYYIKKDLLNPYLKIINPLLLVILFMAAFFNYDRAYTFSACFFCGLFVYFLIIKKAAFLSRFYTAYAGSYFMFLIVNGILTALPVVIYNDHENTGIRIYTIPIEDSAYGMLMLIMNVSIMEFYYRMKKGTYTFIQVQRSL
jgi:lycopene cyclase domain-containing protein